jgi:hypothetical protein
MKLIMLGIYLLLQSCGTLHINNKPYIKEIPPIVDSGGTEHRYRSSQTLDLGNDYALYCLDHHKWETISVRYVPTTLTKLRTEEYIVREHPKNS